MIKLYSKINCGLGPAMPKDMDSYIQLNSCERLQGNWFSVSLGRQSSEEFIGPLTKPENGD